MYKYKAAFILSFSILSVSAFAESSELTTSQEAATVPELTKNFSDKTQLQGAIDLRERELSALRKRATEILSLVSEIVSNGLDQSAAEELKVLTEELKKVNAKLDLLETEIDKIRVMLDNFKEAPVPSQSITSKRFEPTFYGQFQFRKSNKIGANQDSFNFRRLRFGLNYTLDEKSAIRVSFDFATGATQNAGQLRNAFFEYNLGKIGKTQGTSLQIGQQPINLGYEILRSSAERETPERSMFNQRYFPGERSQGVAAIVNLNQSTTLTAGVFNSLTVNDPEQATIGPNAPGRRAAVVTSLRTKGTNFEAGISSFVGTRPKVNYGTTTTVAAPEITREFVYFDASYNGLFVPNLGIRGEFYIGKDRNNLGRNFTGAPLTIADYGQVSVKGWQLQANYNFGLRHQVVFRMDEMDPNTGTVLKNNFRAISLGYIFNFQAGIKFSSFVEEFNEAGNKFRVVTFRTQYRF